jgi:hypothetical protein
LPLEFLRRQVKISGHIKMKPGTKPNLPSIRDERGTMRPDRGDMSLIELVAPDDMPQRPDFLTTAGEEVWMDNISRVMANRLVSERDAELFATFCNLAGANRMAWRAGEVPPLGALTEMRRLAELFGIASAKSRVVKVDKGGPSGNPFSKFRK